MLQTTPASATVTPPPTPEAAVAPDWRTRLPVLSDGTITLRELRLSDAPSLLALLTTDEVTRFISPPPTTLDGFERFILWTQRERAAGRYVCFGIVPTGSEVAVGLFQVRQIDPSFSTAEWGFALGQPYWGSGLFVEGARLVMEFIFDTIGAHRLEARAVVENGRGNGALEKIGAIREGVLNKSFLREEQYLDQVLWALADGDWRRSKVAPGAPIH